VARFCGAPIAFGGVAALHLIAGGVALSSAVKRMKRPALMRGTAVEASRSVNALTQSLEGRVS